MSFTPALGLYIHIPFCARKCPYCDFNTYAGLESLHDTTVDALCIEMERWGPRLAGRTVSTVFVGGGTPTVLTAAQLERIFGAVHRCFTVDAGAEITCEANPGTVDQAKFGVLRSLGVNRLSMGVQSFQPAELHFLGRIHSVEDVGQAFATARKAGFDNINLDFIFGLPGQTEASWCDTLERALALAPEHLSLYSLIVEPNTPLFHWVENGSVPEPDEDQAALHYERAMERLAAGGYIQYEVSNWARRTGACRDDETPELASRHNLIYWRNDDYLGIGPGAHSHLRTEEGSVQVERRWGNRKPVPSYGKRMRAGDSVEDFAEEIAPPVGMGETMMLGLRLVREGVPLDRFTALHGRSLSDAFGTEVDRLCGDGLLTVDARRVRLTPRGLMVGNQVFARFLPDN
ncbi:MAG: radical SAM family heme chaperone HemW [Caldilineaceae bacterium]|nr:radical SAM family heme chaperone HemW [Caldilineaceae bacterium]